MSLNSKSKLRRIATNLCRELRKNSTPAEKLFWENVRNRKFIGKKFNRQFPIYYDLNGKESFYIADFYCHQEKLVIEIDGGYHERQKENDQQRTEIINNLGIKVMRFKNEEIEKNINSVLNKIKKEIKYKTPLLFEEKGLGDE
ncbi:MAG: endonuclease domain-containing protein [Ignavibacteriae bacterium]|nr:endonuclease domain-containing protein [Ignavibacteriota bacterium]NOG98571.1 endonuclease domain-containing protein [Ignavibacteriota bacterium]